MAERTAILSQSGQVPPTNPSFIPGAPSTYHTALGSSNANTGGGKRLSYGRVRGWLDNKPILLYAKLLTILCAIALVPATLFGLLSHLFDPLRWIVAIYIFLGAAIVTLSCFPTVHQATVHRYFLFIALTGGRGFFLTLLGLLAMGMGLLGFLAGLFTTAVGLGHLSIWFCFNDMIAAEIDGIQFAPPKGDNLDKFDYEAAPMEEQEFTQAAPVVSHTTGSAGTYGSAGSYGTLSSGPAVASPQLFNQSSYGSETTTIITGSAGFKS